MHVVSTGRNVSVTRLHLVQDHFTEFHAVYEDRLAHVYGDWRPVVCKVAEKFLARRILDHGFAGVRCDASIDVIPPAPVPAVPPSAWAGIWRKSASVIPWNSGVISAAPDGGEPSGSICTHMCP